MAAETFDPAPLHQAITDIGRLKRETLDVFTTLVLPTWTDPVRHGYPETLYGYMQRTFAMVDLLSTYWRPDGKQTERMVDFLERYTNHPREALSAAVQIWRHKLAHTARPRPLRDAATGKAVRWLLQWYAPHLSREQHFTFTEGDADRTLNLGAIHLIDDLERAATAFVAEVAMTPEMQADAARFEARLQSYIFRVI